MGDMTDSLKTLHTRVIDSRDGYKNAIDAVEDAEMATFLKAAYGEREEFHARIHETMAAENIEIEGEDGSTAAAAHRGLMDLRGAISSGGSGVYAECARGDGYLKDAYDDAISATEGHPEWAFLAEQRAQVAAAIQKAEEKA